VPSEGSPPSPPRVALVFPVFNEEGNLPDLRRRLTAVLSALPSYGFRIVLVDDHSADGTRDLCRRWCAEDSRVSYLRFSRNFGSHAACRAGIEAADADAVVVMAADLQDPPEDIPRLIDEWRRGAHVVWAVRTAREGEPLSSTVPAGVYYWFMRRVAGLDLPPTGADFLLLDRAVRTAILAFPERSSSLFALVSWMGFRQASIPYVKQARHAGRSGWTFRKKVRLFLDSVVSFTLWPLRLVTVLGFGFAAGGLLYACLLVVLRLRGAIEVQGWTALMVVCLVGFGSVMMALGILGEYLWRALEQVRARPRFLVEEQVPLGEEG